MWVAAASAQQPTLANPGLAPPLQMVKYLGASAVTVAASKPQKVTLRFQVDEGKHVNSNLPRSPLLLPTKLRLLPPTDVGTGQITYPAGQDMVFPLAPDEKLNLYSGEFAITAMVSAARYAVPGRFRVHGELQYQACNDRACFPPQKLPVEFDVRVTKSPIRDAQPPRHNPPQSPHVHQ